MPGNDDTTGMVPCYIPARLIDGDRIHDIKLTKIGADRALCTGDVPLDSGAIVALELARPTDGVNVRVTVTISSVRREGLQWGWKPAFHVVFSQSLDLCDPVDAGEDDQGDGEELDLELDEEPAEPAPVSSPPQLPSIDPEAFASADAAPPVGADLPSVDPDVLGGISASGASPLPDGVGEPTRLPGMPPLGVELPPMDEARVDPQRDPTGAPLPEPPSLDPDALVPPRVRTDRLGPGSEPPAPYPGDDAREGEPERDPESAPRSGPTSGAREAAMPPTADAPASPPPAGVSRPAVPAPRAGEGLPPAPGTPLPEHEVSMPWMTQGNVPPTDGPFAGPPPLDASEGDAAGGAPGGEETGATPPSGGAAATGEALPEAASLDGPGEAHGDPWSGIDAGQPVPPPSQPAPDPTGTEAPASGAPASGAPAAAGSPPNIPYRGLYRLDEILTPSRMNDLRQGGSVSARTGDAPWESPAAREVPRRSEPPRGLLGELRKALVRVVPRRDTAQTPWTSPADVPAERVRREARILSQVPVTYQLGGEERRATAQDFSKQGLFLAIEPTDQLPLIGALLRVGFPIELVEESTMVHLIGEVRWLHGEEDPEVAGRGMGLQIDRFETNADRLVFEAYVASLLQE